MGSKDDYMTVFSKLATEIGKVSGVTAIVGGPWRYCNAPLALLSPSENPFIVQTFKSGMTYYANIDVTVIIRDIEPENWLEDITAKLWDILDMLMVDPTLNRACGGIEPVNLVPGRINTGSKIYYGGLIQLRALMFYGIQKP
jgi:hypothetical protein